jgi:type II restriction/modification system DNA methylase subunit YeeA
MTPAEFIGKWSDTGLRERAGSHSHFIDLCHLLGEKPPTDADPSGEWYAFEKGALKTGGGDGWADVWKRGCFAWEYKSPGKDLNAALKQLQYYVRSLENPPLLIVSDMERIELHTNWTNTVQEVHTISLPELEDARRRQLLKKAFSETEVEELKPGKTREALTKEVAEEFVKLAQNLRERGHDPEKVAHFVNRMVFCMFAEDVDLLPDKLFKRMLEASLAEPDSFADNAQKLFAAMARQGGRLDFRRIEWFNGGIFDDESALPLTRADIKVALAAANRNWSSIDPSIMGTLFERGLDPGKRSQLGAHYTDPDKIMLIVNPVIVEPLTREWEEKRAGIESKIEQSRKARSPAARTRAFNEATAIKAEFLERLKNFRVLDPACGSGNFLYLALKELKNLEHRVNTDCEDMGLPRSFPAVGPECVKGIEINPFAAELARVSVWIGEIQWMREHGFDASRDPILKPLQTIECRDALLNPDGSEAEWPQADVIIGNPPFLGDRFHLRDLGEAYIQRLRKHFVGRLRARADLVAYWFKKTQELLLDSRISAFGLVGTKSIARGASRHPSDLVSASPNHSIIDAWTNEPWTIEGADVRVALVCAAKTSPVFPVHRLNGALVSWINPDLTTGVDVTKARILKTNRGVAFQGVKLSGPFDLDGEIARRFLQAVGNPNGRSDTDVIRHFWDIGDVVGRPSDRWVIDFDAQMPETAAALYEAPFEHLREAWRIENERRDRDRLEPLRAREPRSRARWWVHQRPRPELRSALKPLQRFIVTPETSEHRLFVWGDPKTLIQGSLFAIARDDDTSFGILHSRIHEVWATAQGNRMGVGNQRRYNATVTLLGFPFPDGLTPNIPAAQYADDPRAKAIATAAARLNELRENWLNPPDLVQRVPEVVPDYPDRILPVNDEAAKILKKRTLTNLYNERPAWLDHAHRDLDAAVATAYGWPADLSDEQILERLFKLNQERAANQAE